MEIRKETKLSDLLGQYPWLKEELSKVNDKFKMGVTFDAGITGKKG